MSLCLHYLVAVISIFAYNLRGALRPAILCLSISTISWQLSAYLCMICAVHCVLLFFVSLSPPSHLNLLFFVSLSPPSQLVLLFYVSLSPLSRGSYQLICTTYILCAVSSSLVLYVRNKGTCASVAPSH